MNDSFKVAVAAVLVLMFVMISSVHAMDLKRSERKWSGSLELGSTFNGSPALRIVGAYWLPKYLQIWKYGVGFMRLELDTGILDNSDTTLDVGFQPVFRYECHRSDRIWPYIDLGAGIHFLSRANINGRQLGAAQQFSLLAAMGVSFKSGIEIGYRYLHISNANLHSHNDGRDEHLGVVTFFF